MKRYKLIKEYPGSPQLGTITEISNKNNPIWYNLGNWNEFWQEVVDKNPLKLEIGKTYKLQYKYCKSPIRECKITRFTTDNFPWMECSDYNGVVSPDCYDLIEQVVEKDYEILSFKQNSGIKDLWESVDIISDKFARKSGQMFCTKPYTLEQILNNPLYSIHSVKRLSDNVIFTVGDLICRNKSWETGTPCYITRFELKNNKIIVHIKQGDSYGTYPFDNKMYKYSRKEKMFTTEDGVDIFEGDEFYCVTIPNKWTIQKRIGGDGLAFNEELVRKRCFSTKEAAENYIILNKPCLSLNDVFNVYPKLKRSSNNIWTKHALEIKELVKSKL